MRTGDYIRFILSAGIIAGLAYKAEWKWVGVLILLWLASEIFTYVWRSRGEQEDR